MSKLTVDDIVPGDLYVFADPTFSFWVGLVARATRRCGHSNTHYIFEFIELIELADGTYSLGCEIGAQLPINVKYFERYPRIPSASDQLFS
jgi:hypothetical protein